MRLEDLKPTFLGVSLEERRAIFTSYYERREVELESEVVKLPKKAAKGKTKSERKIPVNPEQLDLLRKLGLV